MRNNDTSPSDRSAKTSSPDRFKSSTGLNCIINYNNRSTLIDVMSIVIVQAIARTIE